MKKLCGHEEEIQQLVNSGVSTKDLSKVFLCSERTICRFLRQNKIEIPFRQKKQIDDLRDEISNLANQGWNLHQISKKMEISETTAKRRVIKWGITIQKYSRTISLSKKDFQTVNRDVIIRAVETECSYDGVLKALSLSLSGSNKTKIRHFVKQNNLDIRHFTGALWSKGKILFKREQLETILVKNSPVKRDKIKKLLLHYKILEYRCVTCGNIGVWNEKPLVLELHHINGDNKDFRLDNLQMLCPLCHAQTDNYCKKTFSKNLADPLPVLNLGSSA